jgi:ADP-glucose pyrophosphorylase
VLFGGVEVRRGAEIVDSVVLPGAVIGRGCRLRGVVVDSGHAIADGTRIDQSASGTVPRDRLQPAVLAVEEGNGAWADAACAIA